MGTFLSSFLKKEKEAFSSFIFGRFLSSFFIQKTGAFCRFYYLRNRKQSVVVSVSLLHGAFCFFITWGFLSSCSILMNRVITRSYLMRSYSSSSSATIRRVNLFLLKHCFFWEKKTKKGKWGVMGSGTTMECGGVRTSYMKYKGRRMKGGRMYAMT